MRAHMCLFLLFLGACTRVRKLANWLLALVQQFEQS